MFHGALSITQMVTPDITSAIPRKVPEDKKNKEQFTIVSLHQNVMKCGDLKLSKLKN